MLRVFNAKNTKMEIGEDIVEEEFFLLWNIQLTNSNQVKHG